MPNPKTVERAKKDLRQGKKPSTAAGEFVKEEIDHVRQGKHGARSPQQAIAIGLNEARRAGIPLKPPKRGRTKASTRRSAERAYSKGQTRGSAPVNRGTAKEPSARASRARERVLQQEPHDTVSHAALSRQAKRAAAERRGSGPKTSPNPSASRRKGAGRAAKPPSSRSTRASAQDRASAHKPSSRARTRRGGKPAPPVRPQSKAAKSGIRHR